MKLTSVVALGLMTVGSTSVAWAFAPPAHLDSGNTLQVITGEAARAEPNVTWSTPREAAAAWSKFVADNGAEWRAQWDADTKVPSRIYGAGIAHTKASSDTVVAETMAEKAIAANLALLAPGARIEDFELVSNHFDAATNLRTVGFIRRHQGFEVVGGQVNVRIKNDRLFVFGSGALPVVSVEIPTRRATTKQLEGAALRNVDADFNNVRLHTKAAAPVILPIVRASGQTTFHFVSEVVVQTEKPVGRWSVFVDAANASVVARRQTLMFASGTVKMNAPERRPGSTRLDYPALQATVTLGGTQTQTDDSGMATWNGAGDVSGTIVPIGPEVRVDNEAGARASFNFTLSDGGEVVWDDRGEEQVDAQLNAFIHARIVKERCKVIAPGLRWLQQDQVQATVNIEDSCNAFSDGTTINFFSSSRQCENTGRLPDVVHHEFGHSFHAHVVIRGVGAFDGALSEGASDYLAATITDDSGMGRGFFRTNQPLREIDPNGSEARWPEDRGETHTTGLIFAGTMWDLRKQLILDFGDEATAVAYTDQLWHSALQRSQDIPTSYVEVLAADDDDGNLSNGTPNNCAINEAFARHGLADSELVGPPIGKPSIDQMLRVELPVETLTNACPGATIQSVALDWRVRGQAAGGTLPMVSTQIGYAEQIPSQSAGEVVQYQIEVTLDNGNKIMLPDNPADPYYEHFIGESNEIYCTSFEQDPEGEGWTHALLAGEEREGADDWAFGPVNSPAGSGDPTEAYAGTSVAGNDLGGGNYNGLYQGNKQNILNAPVLPTRGYEVVRMQYRRWLNVEDGDFDSAEILANGSVAWHNYATGSQGNTHHTDKEWRFHDVDVTPFVQNDAVQISFQLTSDGGLELGGWTIDNFCLVGYNTSPPAVCGNGVVESGEACDDGNGAAGDGCEADCTITQISASCGDGNVDPGETCDDGNEIVGDGCELDCTVTITMTPDCVNDPSCNPQVDPNADGLKQIDDAGCGCSSTETPRSAGWALLILGGLVFFRRRR